MKNTASKKDRKGSRQTGSGSNRVDVCDTVVNKGTRAKEDRILM